MYGLESRQTAWCSTSSACTGKSYSQTLPEKWMLFAEPFASVHRSLTECTQFTDRLLHIH